MPLHQHLEKHTIVALLILALGGATTLIVDNWNHDNCAVCYQAIFTAALIVRIACYAIFLVSFATLAKSAQFAQRGWKTIAIVWALAALILVFAVWAHLAYFDDPYMSDSLKRYTPADTPAVFAPGWTIAEVALGKNLAQSYTWTTAITAEVAGVIIISLLMALYLTQVAKLKAIYAYLTPLVGCALLGIYCLIVPWSMSWDFDVFIGDALLGTASLNVVELPFTLFASGFTAPALWITFIAASNIWMARPFGLGR